MTGEQLRQILHESEFSLSDIANKLDMIPQSLNQALNAVDVKSGLLERISKVLGISISSMYGIDTNNEVTNQNINKSIDKRPRIPQTVAAGYLTGFADAVSKNDCEMVEVCKRLPDYDYTIIVKGDSMEPKFEGGDEIAIKKVYSVVEGGKAYVLDTRDGAILKRLYDEGDTFRCVSYNKEYQDFHINKSDIFGIYRVVGLIRI